MTNASLNTANPSITVMMETGYEDGFKFDNGWQVTTASSGTWERGEPIGVTTQGFSLVQDLDVPDDFGDECFVTDNTFYDLNYDVPSSVLGTTDLVSPSIDLSVFSEATLHFDAAYLAADQAGPSSEVMEILASDGANEISLGTIGIDFFLPDPTGWKHYEYVLDDVIPFTEPVNIIYRAMNADTFTIVEALVDHFLIEGSLISSTKTVDVFDLPIQLQPNPFENQVNVAFELPNNWNTNAQIRVMNPFGQVIHETPVNRIDRSVTLHSENWSTGIYFMHITDGLHRSQILRLVKQ